MTNTIKIRVNDILGIEACERKGYFQLLGLNYPKGKSYQMAIVFKELMKGIQFDKFDEEESLKEFHDKLDTSLFLSQDAKDEELSIYNHHIKRYVDYENLQKRDILSRNVSKEVKVGEFNISISADFIFDNGGTIEVVKIKKGEPKMSIRGQKFETQPKNSIDLYLLSELGKSLYADKPIIASLYHLKSKDDTSKKTVDYFEVKKGKNIISYSFDAEEEELVKLRVIDLLEKDFSITSEKTCDTANCDFCNYKNICSYDEKAQGNNLEIVEKAKKATELKLTLPQHDAIMFENGIARINAGAGSGKTTIIALRVVELIRNGCSPSDILLVTFTNKGAQEMKDKIEYWLKKFKLTDVDIKKMFIMTFNSWGEMVIKEKYDKLGFTAEPKLAEKVQRYDIIFELLKEFDKIEGSNYKNPLLDFPNAKGVVVELDEYFDKIKGNFVISADAVVEQLKMLPTKANIIFDMYTRFNEMLLEKNLLQYQDQINHLIYLMDEYSDEFDMFSYKHIILDEYQDTDKIQFDVVSFLVNLERFKSLMVVGDDSQAIFSFRHATPENILRFHEYFEDVKDIFLVDNFRSTPEIIATANALNDVNTNKIDKQLISRQAHGNKPMVQEYRTIEDEYEGISKVVRDTIDNGVNPENIAIVARTKSELFKIESYLNQKDIPYVMDIAEPLLNNSNLHILISFADFFENEYMDLGLLEYLYIFKREEINKMTNEEIRELVEIRKGSFLEKLEACDTEEDRINLYFAIIESIAKKDKAISAFLDELKEKSFFTVNSLFDYLRKLIAYEDEKAVAKDEEVYRAVTLTTAHTSKGKEFDVVINTVNKFKNERGMKLEEIEEERRLFFVAITRAKKQLYITYQTNQDRIKIRNSYCKFIDELKHVEKLEIA